MILREVGSWPPLLEGSQRAVKGGPGLAPCLHARKLRPQRTVTSPENSLMSPEDECLPSYLPLSHSWYPVPGPSRSAPRWNIWNRQSFRRGQSGLWSPPSQNTPERACGHLMCLATKRGRHGPWEADRTAMPSTASVSAT
uniref:Uncharacterized protein n=1 Tax=Rousettus aegyptiacus TaxID=9407 RepID=A0A7J8H0Q7_ROUAE|nr:hypothetical protein HJG63_011231 [Rousettus aegyptiacus]